MSTERLETAFRAAWPVERWSDVPVVVGVSGGADSVALLRLIVAARRTAVPNAEDDWDEKTIVAHVNYGLRGQDSDDDENFLLALCNSLRVTTEFYDVRASREMFERGDGLEANCRRVRYDFFRQTAEKHGARYVAVAHTADDQAETILHHVLRGTGLAGLGGMTMFRPLNDAVTLARPLLDARRADVVAYLESLGQSWREDATNRESVFTRNRLRNELLPQLARDYNADIVRALVRFGDQAREAHEVVRQLAEQLVERCVKPSAAADKAVNIDCASLIGANRHVVREMFVTLWRQRDWPRQSMGYAEWDAMAAMALGNPESEHSRVLPGNIAANRTADTLELKHRGKR